MIKILITAILLLAPTRADGTTFKPPIVVVKKQQNDLTKYLRKISLFESNNNALATNKYGMLGKYQFHPNTLRELNIRVADSVFLHDEKLQDVAMVRYLKANKKELQKVISLWVGKLYNGIKITESGILASAHFSGTVGVLAYFYPDKYKKKQSDANGATIALYMKKFGNFNLELD